LQGQPEESAHYIHERKSEKEDLTIAWYCGGKTTSLGGYGKTKKKCAGRLNGQREGVRNGVVVRANVGLLVA